MRSALIGIGLFVLALALIGCERVAQTIPGHGTTPTPKPAAATPTPITAPPLLAPGTLRLAGAAGAGTDRPAIADADLLKTLVRIQGIDDASPPKVSRSGAGVVVDKQQQLILTSYQLVQPYRADGTRAYTQLLVGAGSGGSAPPEFVAAIVAASPQFDIAVLRITGAREGAQPPGDANAFASAVLADTSSLRRGDRLRVFSPATGGAQQAGVASMITGFSGDGAGEPRAWLKTDMRLSGGAVGAPAFDQSGALIGFCAQPAYDPAAPVALVRPLVRALEVIERARAASADVRFRAPLQHSPALSGSGSAANARDGAVVSRPVFAENALEGSGFRDLFDYATIFRSDTANIDYEFVTQGIPTGAQVQERWYLNGVLQDALSSSYTWSRGNFAVVSDRLTTPNARGIPSGAWTLEVWVGGAVRASATAFVGIAPPDAQLKPVADGFSFASTASAEQLAGERVSATASQLLMFFDYRQAAGVQTIRWVALRDGRSYYQSDALPWAGGDHGTWWVGVTADASGRVGAGTWEFQVYFDNVLSGTARADVR
jgi:hypothetical protein